MTSPEAIRAMTFFAVAVVIGLYVLFIRWRLKIDRAKKAQALDRQTAQSTPSARQMFGAIVPPPEPAPAPTPSDPVTPTTTPAAPPTIPPSAPAATPTRTLVDALTGISMPDALVPHPDVAPRPGVVDRLTLIATDADHGSVRDDMAAALEAIGYQLTWLTNEGLARRDDDEVHVGVYPSASEVQLDGQLAFPYAVPGAVAVDLWTTD